MASENLAIDNNMRNVLGGVTNDVNEEIRRARVNPITGALIVEANITSTNTSIGSTIPGGTAGSVLFLGLGGTLAQDNANFFYDDTQNFLGLGTNTPGATLQIDGSFILNLGGDATGDIYYRDSGGNIVALPIGTNGDVLNVSGGLPAWSASSSQAYNLIQNVGVSVTQRTTINLTNLLTATDVGGKTQLDINVTNLANNSTFLSTLDLSNIGGAINLATQVTGTLIVANGGTGANTLTGVVIGHGASPMTAVSSATVGQVLRVTGSNTFAFGTIDLANNNAVSGTLLPLHGGTGTTGVTGVMVGGGITPVTGTTIVQGDLFYGASSNVLSQLTKDTNATRYLSNTGTNNNPAWAQVNLTNGVTGVLPPANGGGGVVNLSTTCLLYDEFLGGIATPTVGQVYGELNWVFQVDSAGTVARQSGVANHPGIIRITGGATGNQSCALSLGPNSSGTNVGYGTTDQANITTEYLVKLGNAGNQTLIGFAELSTSNDYTNNIGKLALVSKSNIWQGYFVNQTGGTINTTGSTAATSTNWVKLKIVTDNTGANAEFFVDGVSLGTLALAAGSPKSPCIGIIGNGTTIDADYFFVYQVLTR